VLRWPLPALVTWCGTWIAYRLMLEAGLAPAWGAALAALAGAVASVLAATPWRRIVIAAGFPLSLLLSGPAALPSWTWLLLLALVALVYPVNAWRDAPLFPTPPQALTGLPEHVVLAPGAAILDAGCGLGHGLSALRAAYPQARLAGIEWSWPLSFAARMRCPWATIRQGDIWKADWSGFDMVYLFQRPESMARAAAKASSEMRAGTWLVSLEFAVPDHKAQAIARGADGRPVWAYRLPLIRG
jgi:SAM-dependent methyltransferase